MAGDTTLTIIGNLTRDPEMRFTPAGAAVTKFSVAATPRYLDKASGEWKDGEPLFLNCQIWRQAAENLAESSLPKGARVIVTGRLRQRSYEKDGQQRTVFELEVDEIGPSLKYATAQVTKVASSGGRPAAAPADDPWAGASPNRPPNADTSRQASFEDTPPF